jgi:2-haloacid dehalogenase
MDVAFDAVITSDEVRSYKPDLRHFEVFRSRTGVAPGHWAHVACSTFHDIRPARALSVPSVWIDREGTGLQDPTADVTLRDLVRLPQTLERLLAPGPAGG